MWHDPDFASFNADKRQTTHSTNGLAAVRVAHIHMLKSKS